MGKAFSAFQEEAIKGISHTSLLINDTGIDGCHSGQGMKDSLFNKILYGGRFRNPSQKCPAITLNAEREASYTRSSSRSNILGIPPPAFFRRDHNATG